MQRTPATEAAPACNPLVAEWTGPYGGVPPWDVVEPGLFPDAFEQSLAAHRAEILAICEDGASATFQNTFEPLENAGRMLQRVYVMFSVMTVNMSSPAYQQLDMEWSPRIQAAFDDIIFNPQLFARIRAVRGEAGLTAEQNRLVDHTYKHFVRSGAELNKAQQAEMGRINQRLATLFADFANKVMADEDSWITITNAAELSGLPPSLVSSYRTEAQDRDVADGWVIVNTRSSVDPFLTFADDRPLRERVWEASKQRGANGNENNTLGTVEEIVRLRAARATLLGYETHAHWRMEDTMAANPEAADALMRTVWPAAVARVREEVADMSEIARADGADITIEPWDYLYYAEKVRKARYDVEQNETEAYFELNNMIHASMWTAGELYGLRFTEVTGRVPVFHPDVRVWEVHDRDSLIGLFYGDYLARPGKRSGAWASSYREHESFAGYDVSVLSSNNNNFAKSAAGEPVLISRDDAETLFHEFGHALHSLLSRVRYPGLSTTPRDFVEFPSQVMEHWVLTRPVLDRFARHYQTGEPMPETLVAKVHASQKFNQGYRTVEYLSSALVDMALHTVPDGTIDATVFERDALAAIGMPREVAMRHRLPQFSHLFTSDAYSAGYYSYLWSEVMDADTWQAFLESGNVFDPTLADGMRKYILEPGNTTDRAEAYRQFMGREPRVDALMQMRGFPITSEVIL